MKKKEEKIFQDFGFEEKINKRKIAPKCNDDGTLKYKPKRTKYAKDKNIKYETKYRLQFSNELILNKKDYKHFKIE